MRALDKYLALAVLFGCLFLLIAGAGRWSFDALFDHGGSEKNA